MDVICESRIAVVINRDSDGQAAGERAYPQRAERLGVYFVVCNKGDLIAIDHCKQYNCIQRQNWTRYVSLNKLHGRFLVVWE